GSYDHPPDEVIAPVALEPENATTRYRINRSNGNGYPDVRVILRPAKHETTRGLPAAAMTGRAPASTSTQSGHNDSLLAGGRAGRGNPNGRPQFAAEGVEEGLRAVVGERAGGVKRAAGAH